MPAASGTDRAEAPYEAASGAQYIPIRDVEAEHARVEAACPEEAAGASSYSAWT